MAIIRYSAVDAIWPDDELIYIKPMLLGTGAPDVDSYAPRTLLSRIKA